MRYEGLKPCATEGMRYEGLKPCANRGRALRRAKALRLPRACVTKGANVSTRPRVLLADDYPDMVKAISRLLSLDCDIVGTVADGSALLETAQRLEPDVIVLDMHLPNIDSLQACREITHVNPKTKVIMFTAMDGQGVSQAFLEAGASAFISKHASLDLLATIKRLCADRG